MPRIVVNSVHSSETLQERLQETVKGEIFGPQQFKYQHGTSQVERKIHGDPPKQTLVLFQNAKAKTLMTSSVAESGSLRM